jgi:hypothetical protein
MRSLHAATAFQHHVSRLELAGRYAVLSQQDGWLLMTFNDHSHYHAYCILRSYKAYISSHSSFFAMYFYIPKPETKRKCHQDQRLNSVDVGLKAFWKGCDVGLDLTFLTSLCHRK